MKKKKAIKKRLIKPTEETKEKAKETAKKYSIDWGPGLLGFILILTIVFFVAKVLGYTNWDWIWVFSPIWAIPALCASLCCIVVILISVILVVLVIVLGIVRLIDVIRDW